MFVDLFLFAVLGVNSGTHKCLSDREKHQSPPPQHFSKCLLEKSKFLMDASLWSDVGFLPCPHHGRVFTPPTLSIRRVITCEHSLCMCPEPLPEPVVSWKPGTRHRVHTARWLLPLLSLQAAGEPLAASISSFPAYGLVLNP